MVNRRFWLPIVLIIGLLPIWADGAGRVFATPPGRLPKVLHRVFVRALPLRGVETGPRHAPHLLIFFDPDCPFCAHLWQSFHPWRQDFRVRWVPVAYVRPSSLGRAAAILTSPHPGQALQQNEGHFQYQKHLGGLMPLFASSHSLQMAIHLNTQFWLQNLAMLPAIFYEKKIGTQLFLGSPSPRQWKRIAVSATHHWPGN